MKLLNIPTGDDPEADKRTDQQMKKQRPNNPIFLKFTLELDPKQRRVWIEMLKDAGKKQLDPSWYEESPAGTIRLVQIYKK